MKHINNALNFNFNDFGDTDFAFPRNRAYANETQGFRVSMKNRRDNEYRRVDAKRSKISKRIQKSVDIWA